MHLRCVADVKFIAAVIPALEGRLPNISMGMHDQAVSLAADMYVSLYGFLHNHNVSDGLVYIYQMQSFHVSRADAQ